MDAEAVRQLRMGLEWFFLVIGDNGSYHIIGFIGWIVLYCRLYRIVLAGLDRIVSLAGLDRIVSAGLYRIVLAGSGNTGFYVLSGYWLDGTDGMDGLDGALVGRVWDGRTLAPAGTGAPPWALEP